jgi:Zn-dependent protease with chaperone function
MFGNFIYFIVILLIYLIYQPPEENVLSGLEAFALFCGFIVVFVLFTRLQFRQLSRRIADSAFERLDNRYHAIVIRQSVLAILLFTIDVWGLNLPAYFMNLPVFSTFPTLLALFFLGLFILYLVIVWYFSHDAYQRLYRADISKKSYVVSNITFSLPVLLPWLLLSGVADIIDILPFEAPKWFLDTDIGQGVYFLVFLLGVAIIGPGIIKILWRCKPLVSGFARSRIENICARAELEYKDILHWPIFGGKMITAGVMGLVKRFRYILVTNALLHLLEPDELDMVIAHEIGHVKKKHLVFYLVFFAGFLLISHTVVKLIILLIYSSETYFWIITVTGVSEDTVASFATALVFVTLFLLYFRFIFGFFMRNFERQADIYVYSLFDTSRPLVSTLGKIAASSGQSADRPNWHHFSIRERIDYLLKCEADSRWIARHHRKVRNSIVIFLAGIFLLGTTGHYLNIGVVRPKVNAQFIEKVLLKEIDKSPENPNLYLLLGDLYYENREFAAVREAYEKAIELNPESTHGLNNLAWLYATCEDENVRDPARALELAKRAAAIEASPHILDTLAESYYVNERYEDAIEAGKRALSLAKKDRSIYKKQLKKFNEAAGYQ